MAGSWWKSPLTGAGNLNKRADVDDMIYVTYGINGGIEGLAHRYKYTRKAVDYLGCKECGDYKHLNLGDYKLETSKLNNLSSYTDNGSDKRTKKRNYIINILNKAEEDYDANDKK